MLNVFTNVQILSAVARLSGGTYEPILERTRQWRENGPFSTSDKKQFLQEYLTPLLRCGKPSQIPEERWLLKCLSNDQTAFTGFTSLVDIVDNQLGYDGQITLLPLAAFTEPFVSRNLNDIDREALERAREKLIRLDSTKIAEVNEVLNEAEAISPAIKGRKKGKSLLFFYSVTDRPFLLPSKLYQRMADITQLVGQAFSEVASRFKGNVEEAIFQKKDNSPQQFFTGSIDFMVVGDAIYLIDIGAPAIGYLADIKFASEALGRRPEYGLDKLAEIVGRELRVYSGMSEELGFFKLEKSLLVDDLTRRGVIVDQVPGNTFEVGLAGVNYPTTAFDYLTRNQPLRNKILQALSSSLLELGCRIPRGITTAPESLELLRFYEQTRREDFGLVVKKKTFFSEYREGTGYFKPLVTPLWGSELRNNKRGTTLFEEFIPSLVPVDIAGDLNGRRSYEIRLYFCSGGNNVSGGKT